MSAAFRATLVALATTAVGCASAGRHTPQPFPTPDADLHVPTAPARPTPGRADTPSTPEASSGEPASSSSGPVEVVPPAAMPLGAGVVWTAERFLGAPYRNGGGTPAGFDCSGFVQYVFARVGHDVPRTVEDQFQIGQRVAPNRIQPGDLLFFRTTSRRVSHVGIATSATEFIHAPNARSVVRVDSLTTDYWRTRFLGARRLASGSTPVHERR